MFKVNLICTLAPVGIGGSLFSSFCGADAGVTGGHWSRGAGGERKAAPSPSPAAHIWAAAAHICVALGWLMGSGR